VYCVGLTNTVTAVKNAQMAESPVLLIGGAAATLLKGRGALHVLLCMCRVDKYSDSSEECSDG